MAGKLPDLSSSSSLGDIDDILHNQGVSDLSWLDVDTAEYRRSEALPRQNLDIIPEVAKALMEDDRDPRVPALIPLRRNTIVNSNPLERQSPPVRSSAASIRDRIAAYVMVGMGDAQIRQRLLDEFDRPSISASGGDSLAVLNERGVLGNVYVNAAHFPRCAQPGPHREFVARRCSRSLFVLSKPECGGCVHNRRGQCASFDKRIVDEVPYDGKTYAHYLPQLVSERRASEADSPPASGELPMSDRERKERLRAAFNRSPAISREATPMVVQGHSVPKKLVITEDDIQGFWRRRAGAAASEPMPGPLYLMVAKRVMLGMADARALIASSDSEVRNLAFEHGIVGHTYVDGDALGGPREALDLIRSRSLSPDFVLLRQAYSDVRSVEASVCLGSITKLFSKRPPIGRDAFVSACRRAVHSGRMTDRQAESAEGNARDGSDWARLTAQANLYSPPAPQLVSDASPAPRGSFYHGAPGNGSSPSPMDAGEVRRSISHMMNSGLQGKALRSAILARYARSDLVQVPEVGLSISADDGVQGLYFIDPTIYRDYGKGCSEGAGHFRKQGAEHVLAGSACTGCVYQTAPSWCSKYAKRLIRQVPDKLRVEAADRRRLPLAPSIDAPFTNPVDEYGLSAELAVDLNGARSKAIDISIPGPEIRD